MAAAKKSTTAKEPAKAETTKKTAAISKKAAAQPVKEQKPAPKTETKKTTTGSSAKTAKPIKPTKSAPKAEVAPVISNLKSKTYPLSSLPTFPISKRPDNRKNFNAIWEILSQVYPKPDIELDFKTPFELLAATIMSAQCTDVQVNAVTKVLFPKYPTIQDYANANPAVFEKEIYSTGFYHTKTKHIIACAQIIIKEYDSKVPDTMAELVKLPGVGRKTANIVLARGYGIIDGIAVDTHVKRLSNKLGFTENEDPEKIEKDLMKLADKKDYDDLSLTLIFHGRRVCNAQRPKCDICQIQELCPSAFL
ncbi:Endonuclease III [Methanosarcinaceae archaeon Ag5]|uniref:Endonuclease III n=1 Tax=Methanolapillus africanus TaxID=3028297 RepID=A0AAE4MIF0_9EURY|nr:Endonuclease III [Methanosarcinaceae archaeon Ag5]